MFRTEIILLLPLLIVFYIPQIYALPTENHLTTMYWEQAGYLVQNNKAKIIIDEPDMNKYPQSNDRFDIKVYSDSDYDGITVRATETSVNSGLFEAIVILTTGPSKENRLHTVDGDTITAKYVDTTLPADQTAEELEVTGTAIVGARGPPLERVPVADLRLYNTKGNRITEIAIDQQVEIITDLRSSEDKPQKFAYLAQITNEKDEIVLLSWIDGILDQFQSLTPSISWIPSKPGQYMATIFVWESVENPTALSPPLSMDLKVISKQFDAEEFDKELFMKINLVDYKYSYNAKERIDFDIKLDGYYVTTYPPEVLIEDNTGKIIWNNHDFVGNVHFQRIGPFHINKQYSIDEIGGPIKLNSGKYALIIQFENWKIQRDLFVN